MTALLIPIAWLLFSAAFLARRGNGLREAILKGALVVMLVAVASTEVLSQLDAITLLPVAMVWWVAAAGGAVLLLHELRHQRGRLRLKRKLARLRRQAPLTGRAVVFATLVALVILVTAFTAAKQYPYDNDSISYHMPRVANWINQGNVDFYPTVNQRQNFYAPGCTFAMLHVQLLSGTDKYSVLPQYVGMLLCLMLVAMLASRLRVGRTGEWFTVALVATVPILIGQSHCNQNELIVGALLLAFGWLLLRFTDRPSWPRAAWCTCALGLALVTKGTAFFYGAAIGVPLGVRALVLHARRNRSWIRTGVQLGVAALLALACLAPVLIRCEQGGKTYFDNEFTSELRNTRVGLDILGANTLRNAAVHLGLPDEAWNEPIVEWVRGAVGEQAANEESAFRSRPFMMHPQINCFYSTHPLHLALVLLAWLLAPLVRRIPWGMLVSYASISVLGALFFNLCLKWQYWGIRLQLPWLLVSLPLVGAVLFRIRLPRPVRHVLQLAVAFVLFIGALPALLFDSDLPLWETHRAPLMFRDAESVRFGAKVPRFEGKSDFSRVADYLSPFDPDEVGLMVPRGNASQDYNWWVVFGNHACPGRPRIRHVGPNAWPAPDLPDPEWIIVRGRRPDPIESADSGYQQVFKSGGCRVYRRIADPETP